MATPSYPKILVIRRDNIGDLVCTTPLFQALRVRYPTAYISALVNSYNAPVLDNNPFLDEVFAYKKAKHRLAGESKLAIWLKTASLILHLRKKHYDLVILAATSDGARDRNLAWSINAERTLSYSQKKEGGCSHEVERVMGLLHPLNIPLSPAPLIICATSRLAATTTAPLGDTPLIGLHISARKPLQRWPVERFSELAHHLYDRHGARFLVFWSPGGENHPQHPGDDGKAAHLLAMCNKLPLVACKTERLEELIAGLSICDRIICSDGGAMHLAAGLGKPIVCFFGNSDADRWHPWGVNYELLQPESRNVTDISVEQALSAYERLEQRIAGEPKAT